MALPFVTGALTYWWMSGGGFPADFFSFGKAYLSAGVVSYGAFWGALDLEAKILKAKMGDKQAHSATR